MTSNGFNTRAGTGAGVSIGSWVALVISFLAGITRLGTKWNMERSLNSDDALVTGALVTSIGSTVAVYFQATSGLAAPEAQLDSGQITTFMKAEYATGLLYIATLCFAKLSILALLRRISPSELHRRCGLALGALVAVGSFAIEFAAAFQCSTPDVWRSVGNQCYHRVAFWRFVAAFEIVTDLGLILFPVYIIIPLRMQIKPKLLVIASFSTRLFDIAACAVQLYFANGFGSKDETRNSWQWTLIAQIAQCISIVSSCVPYLRPLLISLPSGLMLSNDLLQGTLKGNGYGRSTYKGSGGSGSGNRSNVVPTVKTTVTSGQGSSPDEQEWVDFAPADNTMQLSTARKRIDPQEQSTDDSTVLHGWANDNQGVASWDATSHESQRRILEAGRTDR